MMFLKEDWLALALAGTLFLLASATAYFFFSAANLSSELATIDTQITEIENDADFSVIRDYDALKNKITEIENVARGRLSGIKILDLIERLTIPETSWSAISIDAGAQHVRLSGSVPSSANRYTLIGKQTDNFENEAGITGVTRTTGSGGGVGTSTLAFNLEFKIDKEILFISQP